MVANRSPRSPERPNQAARAPIEPAHPAPIHPRPLAPDPPGPSAQVPLGQAAQQPTPLLLLAPLGQLSGDGQLRELLQERRRHGGSGGGGGQLWYLPPFLLVSLGLGSRDQEGLAALDSGVVSWLQLRFGGVIRATSGVDQATLAAKAQALPAPPPLAALALDTGRVAPGRTPPG